MKWSYKSTVYLTPIVFFIFWQFARFLGNYYNFTNREIYEALSSLLSTAPLDLVTFALFYFYFAPKFFKREKLLINVLLSLAYIFLWGIIWLEYFNIFQKHTDISIVVLFVSSIGHTLIYIVYGIIIRISIEWFKSLHEKEELEKQNAKTELALLRSQINPHFLFNSLNNIHAYSKKDPDLSAFAIIKLSEIMRYMLYEANRELVPLSKEIKYISDFLELQKMRYEFDFIDYRTHNIPGNILIAPLIFIPFVENAFKHGRKDENSKIKISITYQDGKLEFMCSNFLRESTNTEKNQTGGIGIKNIKRRLEMIYKNNYQLEIKHKQKEYFVFLSLKNL